MLTKDRLRISVASVVVGAAFVGAPAEPSWTKFALLAFGILNVILPAPRAEWVSAFAVAATIGALLWPLSFGIVLILAWLLWLPVFVVSWVRAMDPNAGVTPDARASESQSSATAARIAVASLILAVTIASIVYRLLVLHRLDQTAALFVGIPALLAIIVVFAAPPRSATGVACKAVTVGLLVSGLFLGEGILCVLMSAPLFYAIAIAMAKGVESSYEPDEPSRTTLFSCLIVLAVLPMSLEGVTNFTTLNREETVVESRIVRASSGAVARALFEPPRFGRVRPLYLRAGFPSPVFSRIDPSADRRRWVIEMRGGEMRLNGMEPRTAISSWSSRRRGLASSVGAPFPTPAT